MITKAGVQKLLEGVGDDGCVASRWDGTPDRWHLRINDISVLRREVEVELRAIVDGSIVSRKEYTLEPRFGVSWDGNLTLCMDPNAEVDCDAVA